VSLPSTPHHPSPHPFTPPSTWTPFNIFCSPLRKIHRVVHDKKCPKRCGGVSLPSTPLHPFTNMDTLQHFLFTTPKNPSTCPRSEQKKIKHVAVGVSLPSTPHHHHTTLHHTPPPFTNMDTLQHFLFTTSKNPSTCSRT
jgi:hypothetical protein